MQYEKKLKKKKKSYLIILTFDVGDIHVVGGGANIFILLARENINTDQVNFSVTVLACLGGGHFNNFAWASLEK